MLEYKLHDAEELMKENLKVAIKTLKKLDKDLKYLKEQLTTIEVSILSNVS